MFEKTNLVVGDKKYLLMYNEILVYNLRSKNYKIWQNILIIFLVLLM